MPYLRGRTSTPPTASRSGTTGTTNAQDEALIRSAARRVGLQISVASAFAVCVAALLAFGLIRHQNHVEAPPAFGSAHVEPAGDRDALIRNALIIAASLGIVIAGLVGFVIARRAVRPLGQALSLQRRFVADAGHELRTPLTVLHTRAQLLARRLPAGDPARLIADQLLRDSRVLSEIVDELLLSASLSTRPEMGEELDPAGLLTDVADSMQVLAHDSKVSLETTSTPGLRIRGSRAALRRALIALVDNAISHSLDGGTVRLSASAHGRDVVMSVTDEGEGLSGDTRDEVWTRFSRGQEEGTDLATRRPIGNRRYGLGLALVREITSAHGGTASLANSADGTRGAVATISIPASTQAHGSDLRHHSRRG